MLDFAYTISLMPIERRRWWRVVLLATPLCFIGCGAMHPAPPRAEVRGTWLTTTANDAIANPVNTAATMRRLREIGLNTVYVEAWKNGETQFPSMVLSRTLGAPAPDKLPRDLMQETLIEAHRNGLIYIAWFEYGFMAAHQSSMNRLRTQKSAWLSRDITGNDVAPNGFVWMNPLHPEARRFLLDLVLEAVIKYDLDGVQFDDRIVWPHISMGYDDYTREIYAAEHDGRAPPVDHRDPAWMRWRADKVDEVARWFVQEIRARRPGLVLSLSPAVYPWSWENYLLAWPAWSAWTAADRLMAAEFQSTASRSITPRWDEFIPQAYRHSYDAFAHTWRDQIQAVRTRGVDRQHDLIAGIRIVGEGKDSSWEQLRDSIALTREMKNGGHVLWFSRGVLDLYSAALSQFYTSNGPAHSPHFVAGWRRFAVPLQRAQIQNAAAGQVLWTAGANPRDNYRVIGVESGAWQYIDDLPRNLDLSSGGRIVVSVPAKFTRVELLVDRREAMAQLPTRGIQ
ncbi:MAG: family 10 glycosylhydrolase [Burkholderiales bacterium]|nr:family 10 glycosylhydrolase [Burkholderiales bacterium]